MYSLLSDFSIEGGFQALWSQRYGEVREIRGDFGTRPNRGQFDVRSEHKIRASKLDWMHNYNNCLLLMVHNMTKIFLLRGDLEVSSF